MNESERVYASKRVDQHVEALVKKFKTKEAVPVDEIKASIRRITLDLKEKRDDRAIEEANPLPPKAMQKRRKSARP